jgi:hypothetical protein
MDALPSLDRLTHLIQGSTPQPSSLRYSFSGPPPYKFVFAPRAHSSQILDAVSFQWRSKGLAWSNIGAMEDSLENGCNEVTIGESGGEGENWEVQIEAK